MGSKLLQFFSHILNRRKEKWRKWERKSNECGENLNVFWEKWHFVIYGNTHTGIFFSNKTILGRSSPPCCGDFKINFSFYYLIFSQIQEHSSQREKYKMSKSFKWRDEISFFVRIYIKSRKSMKFIRNFPKKKLIYRC